MDALIMLPSYELRVVEEHVRLLQAVAGSVIGSEPILNALSGHAEHVCQAFQMDFCIMRRLKDDKLVLIASHGVPLEKLDQKLSTQGALAGRLLRERLPVSLPDAGSDPNVAGYLNRPNTVPFTSYAGAPMINRGEIIGTLGLFSHGHRRELSEEELDLLQAFGNNLAIAIRNHELYEELQLVNSELDLRVQARTAELEAATRELESFTYAVAHDLRTPLRAIISNSQMLVEDFGEHLPEEAKPMLERQAYCARRLAKMMDGFLELTRIGKHEIKIAPLNLSSLAQEMADIYHRSNAESNVEFEIEPNIQIQGDSKLMRILLQCIFDNSIKFAQKDAATRIRLRTEPDDPMISFLVEDNGIGFDMQYAGKVFQPFERLVGNDEYPGTGIGLASVKRVVDKHRGSVSVKSVEGQGTTLEFRL